MEIVTVFGSSRPVAGDAHYAEALKLGARWLRGGWQSAAAATEV